jgi:hypothetical protein
VASYTASYPRRRYSSKAPLLPDGSVGHFLVLFAFSVVCTLYMFVQLSGKEQTDHMAVEWVSAEDK